MRRNPNEQFTRVFPSTINLDSVNRHNEHAPDDKKIEVGRVNEKVILYCRSLETLEEFQP